MKRSTWVAVLATAAVLLAAGSLPRLPWREAPALARAALARIPGAWPVRARRASVAPAGSSAPAAAAVLRGLGARLDPALARANALLHGPGGFAAAGAAAGVALLAAIALVVALARRGRGGVRARVYRLARGGRAACEIARRTHVPQDAVRALLRPGLGAAPRRRA